MKNKVRLIFAAVLTVVLLASTLFIVTAGSDVTVSFYDGETLVDDVSVAEGNIPTAPDIEEIVLIDGVGYRFVGWADAVDGEPKELVAVTADTTLYAVREAAEFKVEKADGSVVWHAPDEVELSALLSGAAEGDYITACSDVELNGTAAIHCAKSFTLDLNGNTLTANYYVVANNSAHLKFCNGIINITKSNLAQTWESRNNGTPTVEISNVTVKKDSASVNTYFLEMRVGNAILDNVTVNPDEWQVPSSTTYFIRAGYKTKTESQDVKFTVKSCNINLPAISLIFAGGASGQVNGYNLIVDMIGSTVKTEKHIISVTPPATSAANCKLDVNITEKSVISGGGFSNQIAFNVGTNMKAENVNVWADYGVEFSRYPKLAVGTLELGDGDAMLEMVTENGYGVVTDLWVDDHTPITDYAYSFCVVGDTQMTVDYDPNNLHYLYDWILANKDGKNMQYVFGMGDVTNHSQDDEWSIAYDQITRLDGVIDYSLVRGNHDTSATFNAAFNNAAYRSMFTGFYSDELIENAYTTFVAGGTEYLHITLDYHPSDAVVAWAAEIIESYPDHKVIISTHSYLAADGTLDTRNDGSGTNSGAQLWSKLVSQYENVFLVLSGHVFSTELQCLQSKGVNGNTVTQLMVNGQTLDYRNGAMGLVAMLYFSQDGNTVAVEYYSTVYDRYLGKNSQFTLTVGDSSVPVPPSEDTLYAVTNTDGNTSYYDDTYTFSGLLTSDLVADGAYITVFGDITVDAGFKMTKNLTIDLNGNTVSTDGGKLQGGKKTVNILNGTVDITNNPLLYIDTAYGASIFNLKNIDVINSGGDSRDWGLADMRSGTVNLNNVRLKAEDWNGVTQPLFTAGYRTGSVSGAININIKNSSLDLGDIAVNLVEFTAQSAETKGWTGNVTVTDSEIAVGGYLVQAKPTAATAPNCGLNLSFSGKTTLDTDTFCNILGDIPSEKISISFGIGVKLGGVPTVDGADISFSGGILAIHPETGLYTVANVADAACKLVDDDGNVYVYSISSSFTKELAQLAQDASCSIVFLKDMTMPAGTSSSSQYNIKAATLEIDLNGKTLTMPNYARFTTDANTVLSVSNGIVQHGYTVFYSYSGNSAATSFTATNVKFVATSSNQVFDHRIGILTLIDCEFEFRTNPTSECFVFALGNVKDTKNTAKVVLTRTDINCTGDARSLFKIYGGRSVTVEATDCDFSVGSEAFIVNAIQSTNYTGTGRVSDSFTFDNCTLTKTNGEGLVSAAYSEISIKAISTVLPTCIEQGYKATTNLVSGEISRSNIVDAIGHSYDNDEDVDCNVCGEIREVSSPAEGECGASATWRYEDGVLYIEGTGSMNAFSSKNAPWKDYKDEITTVVVAEGIRSIGKSAFYGCESLASVQLPATLKTIGAYAFYGCTALTEITIPESVTTIREYAFRRSGLTAINFGINYGWSAGDMAINSFELSASGAAELLKKASFNVDWTRDVNAEPQISNLIAAGSVGTGIKWTLDKDGVLVIEGNGAIRDFTTNGAPWNEYKAEITKVVIGEGITKIGKSSFYGYEAITTVSLPSTLTGIGNYAFYGCKGLTNVTIPASVNTICAYAFRKSGVTAIIFEDVSGWTYGGEAIPETYLSNAANILKKVFYTNIWSK